MIKKYVAQTPDGQEFYDLLEKLNVDIEYNKRPDEKTRLDYFLAIEVWLQKHDKLPDEVAQIFNFDTWTKLVSYGLSKNKKVANYADKERKKIGTFDDWSQEMASIYGFSTQKEQYDYAFGRALSLGDISQLKYLMKNDHVINSCLGVEYRSRVLQRIAELLKS